MRMKVAGLSVPFDVRARQDDDRMMMFALLYDGGQRVDPIKVAKDGTVLDGRHRLSAIQYLEREEIDVEVVVGCMDRVTQIAYAFKANTGGALPPDHDGLAHTIGLLLDEGVPKTKIVSFIPSLPPSLVRKFVDQVHARRVATLLHRAKAAVIDDEMNVAEAATHFEVDGDALRAALRGKRQQQGTQVEAIKTNASLRFRGFSRTNHAVVEQLLDQLDDGHVTPAQMREVLKHINRLFRVTARSFARWTAQAEAKMLGGMR